MSFLRRLQRGLSKANRYVDVADDAVQTVSDVVSQLDNVKANHLTTNQRLDLMDRRLEVVEHEINQLKEKGHEV